jgi:muramoyltetrapeptide carboxypeptidase
MNRDRLKIGVVAPGSRIEPGVEEAVVRLAATLYPACPPDIRFHPQCFLSAGHFAGDDGTRAQAFLDVANDPSVQVLWFARGGYGACRLAERLLPDLGAAARRKVYLGYSDAGVLLAALYRAGFARLAHGPMPRDIVRPGGEAAIRRALAFLTDNAADSLEPSITPANPTAAFNITVLSHLIGTPLQPDLAGHVVMLEEVGEQLYRIDRALCHITSNREIRKTAGLMLGRCSNVPDNRPAFGQSEDEIVRHWCARSGIPYLGRADIGHDADNKIVPFGLWQHIARTEMGNGHVEQ